MPKLSLVVAIYNIEAYIEKCLDSIHHQTNQDFECILVDDGSLDQSSLIAQRYANLYPNFQYFRKENGGLSDARNFGLTKCTSQYVGFIDGDDTIHEEYVEKCINKIEETLADMIVFDYYQYFGSMDKTYYMSSFLENKTSCNPKKNPEILTKIYSAAWNKIYRISLFKDYQIAYPKGLLYEDFATTFRLIQHAKNVVYIPSPLYFYVADRKGSIMNTFKQSSLQLMTSIRLVLEDYKKNGIFEQFYDELKYLSYRNLIFGFRKLVFCTDQVLTNTYINEGFSLLYHYFGRSLKCKYPIIVDKSDQVYTSSWKLKLYLAYRKVRKKK